MHGVTVRTAAGHVGVPDETVRRDDGVVAGSGGQGRHRYVFDPDDDGVPRLRALHGHRPCHLVSSLDFRRDHRSPAARHRVRHDMAAVPDRPQHGFSGIENPVGKLVHKHRRRAFRRPLFNRTPRGFHRPFSFLHKTSVSFHLPREGNTSTVTPCFYKTSIMAGFFRVNTKPGRRPAQPTGIAAKPYNRTGLSGGR